MVVSHFDSLSRYNAADIEGSGDRQLSRTIKQICQQRVTVIINVCWNFQMLLVRLKLCRSFMQACIKRYLKRVVSFLVIPKIYNLKRSLFTCMTIEPQIYIIVATVHVNKQQNYKDAKCKKMLHIDVYLVSIYTEYVFIFHDYRRNLS